MYHELASVTLRDGFAATLGIIRGPDEEWAERLDNLLEHKEEIWVWQNRIALRESIDIEAHYYIAHVDGVPSANVSIFDKNGVGIFGHVFTREDRRGLGAASLLTAKSIEDFTARGGKALVLGTSYDSSAYHIYRRRGFRGTEEGSGQMVYYSDSREEFESSFFNAADQEIVTPGWSEWPLSWPLMEADIPGVVRSIRMSLLGRSNTEGPMLGTLREQLHATADRPPTCLISRQRTSGAVMAMASWCWHRVWPGSCVVDVFAHPSAWDAAAELLIKLELPKAERTLAYVDEQTPAKAALLDSAGFHAGPTFKRRVAANAARTMYVDVTEYAK